MSREQSQQIRPTQFLTSYGPGAILDTLNGPRLIKRFADSGVFGSRQVQEFEILEPALSQLLPERGRIFRLPTNADHDESDAKAIYETRPFPRWSLCPWHGLLYLRRFEQKSLKACPECEPFPTTYQAWQRAREQSVSFVSACRNGHLDDVSWSYLIHQQAQKEDCKPDTIRWKGAGGPLKEVVLECPKCQTQARLSDLYHRDHSCRGRFPEDSGSSFGSCDLKARISQRAASDLYLPEVRTALTLPYLDSPLHDALRHDTIFTLLERELRATQSLSEEQWDDLTLGSRIPAELRQTVLKADLVSRNEAAKQILIESQATDENQTRANELRVLLQASRDGNQRSRHFELDVTGAREVAMAKHLTLRITPVTRLRMTAAQIGYRRLGGELVQTEYRVRGEPWFPGIEQYGEGLFLELLTTARTTGPVWSAWQTRFEEHGDVTKHPSMVWWHTLSHRLIRALAIHSGYSAASVRERLYLNKDQGGLLIYAVQPGGDGTLGGLIALVPKFERLLRASLMSLDCCSNDPLCGEQTISATRQSGASCYACCLLSETSCEMRNLSLDRSLLLETLVPDG